MDFGPTFEQLRKEIDLAKAPVIAWEDAFHKEKGRHPSPDDFQNAPYKVRRSYDAYRALKKELVRSERRRAELKYKSVMFSPKTPPRGNFKENGKLKSCPSFNSKYSPKTTLQIIKSQSQELRALLNKSNPPWQGKRLSFFEKGEKSSENFEIEEFKSKEEYSKRKSLFLLNYDNKESSNNSFSQNQSVVSTTSPRPQKIKDSCLASCDTLCSSASQNTSSFSTGPPKSFSSFFSETQNSFTFSNKDEDEFEFSIDTNMDKKGLSALFEGPIKLSHPFQAPNNKQLISTPELSSKSNEDNNFQLERIFKFPDLRLPSVPSSILSSPLKQSSEVEIELINANISSLAKALEETSSYSEELEKVTETRKKKSFVPKKSSINLKKSLSKSTPKKNEVDKNNLKKDTPKKNNIANINTPKKNEATNKKVRPKKKAKIVAKKVENSVVGVIDKNDKKGEKNKKRKLDSLDFEEEAPEFNGKRGRKRARLSKEAAFNIKVKSGKINENFVKIDVSKKVFARGRGRSGRYKRGKFERGEESMDPRNKLAKCWKCGEIGHKANFCIRQGIVSKEYEPENLDDSPYPTIEEAMEMARLEKSTKSTLQKLTVSIKNGVEIISIPDSQLDISQVISQNYPELNKSTPLDSDLGNISQQKNNEENDVEKEIEDEEEKEYTLKLLVPEEVENSLLEESVRSSELESSFSFGHEEEVYNPIEPYLSSPHYADLTEEEEGILHDALNKFKYSEFRHGQKEGIVRVLRGLSTLVVLSTGAGKSLCYLLPAYLYAQKYPESLVICVSPLVSLMEDQNTNMPDFLNGECLHTNMSESKRNKVLEKIRKKRVNILIVSPEAICNGLFGLLKEDDFPDIPFACIDEVHCLSEWSHNFRPSYLKLCHILRSKLRVKTILGLTATATSSTVRSICSHLHVDPRSTIKGEVIPPNLRVSCSRDLNREEALLALLSSPRFENCDSVIIYCTRREQCDRLATFLRINLPFSTQGVNNVNRRTRVSTDCEPYHAGMTPARRKCVQELFMEGKIRIVVATVAFGMGIDKSNIRSVIHYNMPKTFESFVQEVGRAGRDGLPAECHVFLDNIKGKDICELKKHIYANSVDRTTIRKLLRRVFEPCVCLAKKNEDEEEIEGKIKCPGHEISFPVEETVKNLDLPSENIETLLCYLELYPPKKLIKILSKCYRKCMITSYQGPVLLKRTCFRSPPLAAAVALERSRKNFSDDQNFIHFNFVEVANKLNLESNRVRRDLASLQWIQTQFENKDNEQVTKYRKSDLIVEFSELSFRILAPGALSEKEQDTILDYLHSRNVEQEKLQLFQLYQTHDAFYKMSYPKVDFLFDACPLDKSDMLKKDIETYFSQVEIGVPDDWRPVLQGKEKKAEVLQTIRSLVNSHNDENLTGRSIAKILQGISSPRFPLEEWKWKKGYWRAHMDVDFHLIAQWAVKEIA